MKSLINVIFLLFTLSFYGQNDTISVVKTSNISVVSADKMNVVYRGLPNPISISVPNCKSFTATGDGLYKNNDGSYQIVPRAGLETTITIEIVLTDNSIKKEQHIFRIKNIPNLYGKINGLYCNQSILLMTKKELINSELTIGFLKEFAYEFNFELQQFVVEISNKLIVVKGNKFTNEVIDLINKLPINSRFKITDLKSNINCKNCSQKPIQSIEIMIVEDNYFKNDEFEK